MPSCEQHPSGKREKLKIKDEKKKKGKGKGTAIPVQVWTGPEGSRKLRLPDSKTIST